MCKIKMRQVFIFILLTALLSGGIAAQAFACGCGGGNSTPSGSSGHSVSPTVFFYPPPPGFPEKWFIKDVVESIDKKGLKLEDVKDTTEVDYSSLPGRAKEGVRFSSPSLIKEIEGCILSFEDKDTLEKVQKYFLESNEKGDYYSWSFAKDNILMILGGALPESQAREFESALYDLKKQR